MEPKRITKQTAEREVYEPPMLAEIGQFSELTSGGNGFFTREEHLYYDN